MIDERELAYLRRCIAYEYMKGHEPTDLIAYYGELIHDDTQTSVQNTRTSTNIPREEPEYERLEDRCHDPREL